MSSGDNNVFTKAELVEMWKRPVDRQYNVAVAKMMEAISATRGGGNTLFLRRKRQFPALGYVL